MWRNGLGGCVVGRRAARRDGDRRFVMFGDRMPNRRVLALDIEASGIGDATFPTEIALADTATGTVRSWLIRSADAWLDGLDTGEWIWDPEAEATHGITLDTLLAEGQPVEDVCAELDEAVGDALVVSADRDADTAWVLTLYAAVRRRPRWAVECWWEQAREAAGVGWPGQGIPPSPEVEAALAEARRRVPTEHRAVPDAERLALALRLLGDADG